MRRLSGRPALARAAALLHALACTLILTASAGANVLPEKTLSLPVRAPSIGNLSVGSATLSVSFTDTQATAVAAAPSVALGKGQVFRLDTCIKKRAIGVPREYRTTCEDKIVDTRSNPGKVTVEAPSVTETLARPATGRRAYFSYLVSVSQRQSGGAFKEVATSWPSNGVAGAAVGIPSAGSTTAPLPASEGAAHSSGKTGGINTGLPDSMCMGREGPDPSPPEEGVSTSALGPDAPAYYEVGEPTGPYAGQPPKGVMLLVHGGGWSAHGAGYVAALRPDADRWRARGWRTLNITYPPCRDSLDAVMWFYDRAREKWGESMPYCAYGTSAGGNMALVLAAARQSLACAIDAAGPANVTSLAGQRTLHPLAIARVDGPHWTYNLVIAAFGPDNAGFLSPAIWPIKARVLFGVATEDWYIPYAQGTELQAQMLARDPGAYVDVQQLTAGASPWVHASVSADSLDRFHAGEEELVAPLVD
jgi:hypothetical protein